MRLHNKAPKIMTCSAAILIITAVTLPVYLIEDVTYKKPSAIHIDK
ncbi:hypothetical protein OAP63_13925 [Vibrio sp.]|nr:hypothetical protein [Vibrio viridaestus]MDC0611825.1 hypothetical protein [Vibrio sp.]